MACAARHVARVARFLLRIELTLFKQISILQYGLKYIYIFIYICHRCLLLTCSGLFFITGKNDWAIRTEQYCLYVCIYIYIYIEIKSYTD